MSAEHHESLMGGWAGDAQQMLSTCRERHLSGHYCTGRNWPLGGLFSGNFMNIAVEYKLCMIIDMIKVFLTYVTQ